MKKFLRILFHRVVFIGLAILLQAAFLVTIIWRFNNYFVYFYAASTILSLSVVLLIVNGKSNPGYKIAWIILILLFPIFGGLFYLMFGKNSFTASGRKKMKSIQEEIVSVIPETNPVLQDLTGIDKNAGNQSRYIEKYAYSPVHTNTYTKFLSPGEMKFAHMKEELRKARHYIFMEYFIIEEGVMWNEILDILREKAAAGVDVRIIYDDIGSLFTLPYRYDKKLEAMGIKCSIFNPFVPVLSLKFNNRDHRKICVIDGHTGFTGGINLADEYINAKVKHGHWKDSSIMIKGDAVWNLTVMFLSLWSYIRGEETDFSSYHPYEYCKEPVQSDGWVQPYSDNPLDEEAVGETVYFNLINKAKQYVYITTPYLIIDNEMVTALSDAAKAGVDVRIITPHIGDKWFVHTVTRSYYEILIENGVGIYEYTPGFIHAKTFTVDDELATVGTVNLDYRSLYLHFECGVWMYKTDSIREMKKDFLETLSKCTQITLEQCRRTKWYVRWIRSILRAFAPLM